MKLHTPKPDEKFVLLIDDVNADDLEIYFFPTREEAEAYVIDQYGDIPDTLEEGGEQYRDDERSNCNIHIGEIVSRTRL